jgi:hypothetical protein
MGNRRRQRRTAPMIHPTLLKYEEGELGGQVVRIGCLKCCEGCRLGSGLRFRA